MDEGRLKDLIQIQHYIFCVHRRLDQMFCNHFELGWKLTRVNTNSDSKLLSKPFYSILIPSLLKIEWPSLFRVMLSIDQSQNRRRCEMCIMQKIDKPCVNTMCYCVVAWDEVGTIFQM
jgi:hypothetical protein